VCDIGMRIFLIAFVVACVFVYILH
jgi:hypothetical protein